MSPTLVWIDGRLVPAPDAKVSVFDHGLTVGDGVFETMKVLPGRDGVDHAFALGRHLDRLDRSQSVLGLAPAIDRATIQRAVREVIAANGGPAGNAGRIRITVTGGESPLGSGRGTDPATVIIASSAASPWPPTSHVALVPYTRNERAATAGVKSTSYADNVVALRWAADRGADEAIFANTRGELCEGTGSNVFLVREGVVVTPPLSSGCLAGITREILLEIAPEIREVDLPVGALSDAEEAFLTSSTRDLHPIQTVDGHPLPACPGPVTDELRRRFALVDE